VSNDCKWCSEGLKPRIAHCSAILRWGIRWMTSVESCTIGDCDLVHPEWLFYRVFDWNIFAIIMIWALCQLFEPFGDFYWYLLTVLTFYWIQSCYISLFFALSHVYSVLTLTWSFKWYFGLRNMFYYCPSGLWGFWLSKAEGLFCEETFDIDYEVEVLRYVRHEVAWLIWGRGPSDDATRWLDIALGP